MRTSYINWSRSKYHHTPIGTMISRATNSNDVGLILQNWKIQFQQRVNDIFVPLWLRFNFDGTSIWLLLLCQNLHRNNKKPFELGPDLLCLCVFVFCICVCIGICIATTRNHLNLALISYAFVYAYTSKIFAYYDFPHSHAFLLKDNNHISIFQEARHISFPSPFTIFMDRKFPFDKKYVMVIYSTAIWGASRRGTCARGDCIRTSLISW